MNLHEYQSKTLFAEYGIAVPEFRVISQSSQVKAKLDELGGERWVVKAQVHAGGRGKAGGVKITDSKTEVEEFVSSMLGHNLVTFQTDAKGQPVHQILIEQPCEIERELYLGAVIDRSLRQVVFISY